MCTASTVCYLPWPSSSHRRSATSGVNASHRTKVPMMGSPASSTVACPSGRSSARAALRVGRGGRTGLRSRAPEREGRGGGAAPVSAFPEAFVLRCCPRRPGAAPPLPAAMVWFPWHPEQVVDPPGPAIPVLTGVPARWRSLAAKMGAGTCACPAPARARALRDVSVARLRRAQQAPLTRAAPYPPRRTFQMKRPRFSWTASATRLKPRTSSRRVTRACGRWQPRACDQPACSSCATPRKALNSALLRNRQGTLAANCWLLSAIACLTEYQDAIPILFADRGRALQEITKARRRRSRC